MFSIDENEHIIGAMAYNKTDTYKYLLFVTKNGMIKKTDTSEYKTKRTTGIQGIKLKAGDEIVDIAFINREEYLIATHEGLGIKIDTTELPATGRVTQGVYGIKLNKNDYVISGTKISNDTQYLATISEKGYIKKTNIAEYPVANRYTKGSALLKLDDNDYLSAILALSERDKEVLVLSTTNIIKFPVSEISLSSRATKGVRSMKIEEKDRIKNLVKSIE
jgi:DNA gyrase subunit A